MRFAVLDSVARALARTFRRSSPLLRPNSSERAWMIGGLQEGEASFRALADLVPFAILIFQDDRIVYANRVAKELSGYDTEEALDVSPWQVVHPDHVELVRGRSLQRLAGDDGIPEHYEFKIVTKQGAERWVECSVAVIPFDGRPAIVAAFSNITERRHSQDVQSAIYEISEAAHSAESLDELFSSLHRIVGRLMPARNFYIALHDPETSTLSFPYFVDEVDATPEAPQSFGKGLTEYVLRTGKPLLATPQVFEDLCLKEEVELVGAPSFDWLGVPLKVSDRTIGVLVVQSYTGTVRYGEADREILTYVSMQAAQAIERKRAEQALRESQRKLFTLMGNLPGMAYRCANDEDWTMEFVSEGCLHLTGHHPADLVANRTIAYVEIMDPADRDAVRKTVEEAVARRGYFEMAYRIRTASGEQKWVWERGRGVFSAEDKLLALEGFVSDISEKMKAEEALRRSEERYRLALEATQEIMYDWDIANDTVFWNPTLTRMLGYDPEEMGGTVEGWLGRVHPDDAARVRRELTAAVNQGEIFSSEYRAKRKTGEFAALLDRGLILRDPDGEAVRLVGAITDLTASKQLQDQLRQVQKIEAVGRLAGGIAHDFNNLLTALLGSTELLQRRLSEDHLAQQELATIQRTARRAAAFTQSLLAFARRQVLEPTNLEVSSFVSEALPMLRRLIPENIRIDFRAGGLLTVRADRGQLTQILMNLCVNARDAMPAGGTITISTEDVTMDKAFIANHEGAKPGRYVSLAVTDTGDGIPPADMPHIFEPFFTTKDRDKGTGLGLSTVYGIVKQHGGFVYADSRPGNGCTFSVYLPAIVAPGRTQEDPIEPATRGGPETILVVEDESEVRQVLVQALSGFGYHVYEAADGRDALSLLRSGNCGIDLVLTDVVMPRMGGMELCQAARAITPGLRFLFSSGYTEDTVHVGFVKKEGIFFLGKPYGIDTLARKVREVLDSGQPTPDFDRK